MLLLLVPDLPELLGPRVEYPQLLLYRVLLLERPRQLRPPQRLHLLERLDQLQVLRLPLVAHALLQLQLQLRVHLEVTNEVGRCLADLDRRFFGFLRQKFVIQLRHLPVGADIIRLETLFKVGVLVHQWAHGRAIGLHY